MGNNNIAKMLFLITQIGITMLTTIFLCLGIGYVIDKAFGTHLMVWFIVLGVLAGFRSVGILLKKFIGSMKDNKEEYLIGSNPTPDENDWPDGESEMDED